MKLAEVDWTSNLPVFQTVQLEHLSSTVVSVEVSVLFKTVTMGPLYGGGKELPLKNQHPPPKKEMGMEW